MPQYINKDAVVKEIERRENESWNLLPNASDVIEDKYSKEDAIIIGEYNALESLEKFINTLEVKEVDLEEEARKWQDKVYLECGYQDSYGTPHAPFHKIGDAFIAGAKFIIKAQKGE